MPPEFVLLSCNFKDLQIHQQLSEKNLTNEQIFSLLNNTFEAIRRKTYDFAPIDKKGIEAFASPTIKKINSLDDLIAVLGETKPAALEEKMKTYCKDDRSPERIIEKKLSPVTDIATGYYFSLLFEKLFPVKISSSGKPPKKEFRFAANYNGWVVIRKVNMAVAENKEVLACLVHTLESIDKKFMQFHGDSASFTALDVLLAKYPSRKSFGKLLLLLREGQKERLLTHNDPFLRKYFLYKLLAQLGHSPYLSGELLGGIYPELKIPKPRGRLKKN